MNKVAAAAAHALARTLQTVKREEEEEERYTGFSMG